MTFYITEDIKHAEEILYIDSNLSVKYNEKIYTIKEGEYKYIKEKKTINVDNKEVVTYGYAILNINVN